MQGLPSLSETERSSKKRARGPVMPRMSRSSGASEELLSCGCLRQRRAVCLNPVNRFQDVIQVVALGQEQVLSYRNRPCANLAVAFQLVEAIAIAFEPLGVE